MKKIFSALLVCITVLSLSLNVSAEIEIPSHYPDSERGIVSEDNNYLYAALDDGSGICFEGTNIKNLTVLNIPKIIDGKKVTGVFSAEVDSKCLVKANFSDTIETVYYESFFPSTKYEDTVPVCEIMLSHSLKQIDIFGFYPYLKRESPTYERELKLKYLIFPCETVTVDKLAFKRNNIGSIVFEGAPTLRSRSFSVDSDGLGDGPEYTPCDVYFADNIDNVAADTFSFDTPITDDVLGTGSERLPCPGVTIYKKPGADGFEKFEDKGYTVKEYTDEWWKNIKEIESVKITGKGIIETKNSNVKGTVKNLGWSASNDPLQYLSHKYSLKMNSGEKVKLSGTFAPADAFDDRMFFVSLDEDIVKVDVDSGEVTALKKGAATVRCVAASGVFSDVVVYVDGATAADLPDNSTPATTATAANTTATADTTKSTPKTTKTSEPAKGSKVNPIYIAVPAAAVVILASAVVLTKKKKK